MKKIKIALAQVASEFGNANINLEKGKALVEKAAAENANIICFPELFYGGYYLKKRDMHAIAESQNGRFVHVMQELAKAYNIHIISGYAESTNIIDEVYNSMIFIDNLGNVIGNTRKCYLWGKEKNQFKSGDSYPVYDTTFGKIGILICYDCEYPEPARIMALKGAKLIFVPSVWSNEAFNRWNIDLAATSLYNLLFTAGVNTIGKGICGKSQVFNPYGLQIAEASENKEEILYCNIDLNIVADAREKIPYFTDFNHETFPMEIIKKF
ncbi:nitrilase-related carbon-nitrogen hydrolase [Fusobacterium sp. PH5-44]|uniref:nitrilase-related carbon-nitrogen hydrolase n=1 Tax=unclassified Fusobacterium TaxID=2648384 RepID=UPI003D236004